MHCTVACSTKSNQILARIVTGMATKFLMMDLKIDHCAARLASPTVAAQDLLAQVFILFAIEP